jgi:hypothetical protein
MRLYRQSRGNELVRLVVDQTLHVLVLAGLTIFA